MSKHLLLLLLSLIFGLLSFAESQTMWAKYQGNPVFSGGAAGTWNRHVWRPDVLYNTDSLRFEMWYDASDGPPGWEPYRIGFATSSDGITWTTLDTAVLTPTSGEWDDAAVLWSSVLRENSQYKMWYTGYSYGNTDYKIGYATSDDGITWTKEPAPVITPGPNLWDLGGCGATTVLPTATGYEMWYTGVDAAGSPAQIGYATSTDGINWTKYLNNPVLTVGSAGEWDDLSIISSDVIKIDSIYYLSYDGRQSNITISRIGYATSDNGITWTKYDDSTTTNPPFAESDPVLIPSPGLWDGTYVAYGSVMLIGDTFHMWYTGSRTPTPTNLWRIGYATAPDCTFTGLFEIDDIFVPDDHLLKQNYPNPFNPSTTIEFDLPKTSEVSLKVFNILGEEVATLVSDRLSAGSYSYEWSRPAGIASGVYLYRLQAGDPSKGAGQGYVETRKMVLMK